MQIAISLGSNLGQRRGHLEHAVEALKIDVRDLRVSSFLETAPVGVGGEHGPFLNAAVVGETSLSARDLLDRLAEIEGERGRARPYPLSPRTLDLDLVLYGGCVIDEDGLIVPHPRFREREFVLRPLAEIAPDMVDPVSGLRVADLLRQLLRDESR